MVRLRRKPAEVELTPISFPEPEPEPKGPFPGDPYEGSDVVFCSDGWHYAYIDGEPARSYPLAWSVERLCWVYAGPGDLRHNARFGDIHSTLTVDGG